MASERAGSWGWFSVWALVGGGYGLSVIGIASIGLFVLPLAIIATVPLALLPWTRRGFPGLIAGLGLAPLFVAYNNRSGPGYVCRGTLASGSCGPQFNPWPWLAAAVLLIVIGAAVSVLTSRFEPKGASSR